jgi:hypothetical protein
MEKITVKIYINFNRTITPLADGNLRVRVLLNIVEIFRGRL